MQAGRWAAVHGARRWTIKVKQADEVSRDGYQPLSLTLTGFKGIRSGLGRDTLTLDLEALVGDAQLVPLRAATGAGRPRSWTTCTP